MLLGSSLGVFPGFFTYPTVPRITRLERISSFFFPEKSSSLDFSLPARGIWLYNLVQVLTNSGHKVPCNSSVNLASIMQATARFKMVGKTLSTFPFIWGVCGGVNSGMKSNSSDSASIPLLFSDALSALMYLVSIPLNFVHSRNDLRCLTESDFLCMKVLQAFPE